MPTTSPAASLATNTKSMTRINPLSTNSASAGAASPVNLFPGNATTRISTGPISIPSPVSRHARKSRVTLASATLSAHQGRARAKRGTRGPSGERGTVGAPRRLVAARVHRRGRSRIRGSDPPAGCSPPRRRSTGARHRVRRGSGGPPHRGSGHPRRRPGPRMVTGRGRTRTRRRAGVRAGTRRGPALPARRRSTRWWCAQRSSTSMNTRPRSGRSRGCSSPVDSSSSSCAIRSCNHPGSGWIDDQILGEQYWRVGAYLREDRAFDEVAPGVDLLFIHRPLSAYIHAMGTAGLLIEDMEEPAPLPAADRRDRKLRGRRHDPTRVAPSFPAYRELTRSAPHE